MRIFFRPIDLFCTLSSVFLSAFSPGSQSREREKKRRGEKRQKDLTFNHAFETKTAPPESRRDKNKATHRSLRRTLRPTFDSLFLSLTLALERDTRDTETQRLFTRERVRVKNFDSPSFFFFFFSIKKTPFSLVRSCIFYSLSFISKKKKLYHTLPPLFSPVSETTDRRARTRSSQKSLCCASRERETERGSRALSLTLSCRRLKREDCFFCPLSWWSKRFFEKLN